MLPEEDRQALKKNGYQITAKGVVPIAHPLQTYNSKSSSSAAQHRQGERDSINNPRPIQPKATPNLRGMSADAAERWSAGSSPKPKPTPNLRGMSADAAERWSAGSSLKPKPKPTSTALNTRRYGSADAEERRHAGSSLKPKPKPTSTPIAANTWLHGSADAEERRHAGSSPQPKPKPNLRGMSADAAERWSNGASPQPKPKPNLRGMSADAAERWSAGSSPKPQLAIAPLGEQPTKDRPLPPPPAPEPPKQDNKSLLDRGKDFFGGYVNFQKDVNIGAAKAVWDMGKGLGSLAKSGLEFQRDVYTNPEKAQQTLSNLSGNVQQIAKHPGQVWDALKQPYVDAINSGHPGEAFGRGFVDIGSFFVPGGAIGKAGEGANVLSKVSKVGDVSRGLDEAANLGRGAEAGEALGKYKPLPKLPPSTLHTKGYKPPLGERTFEGYVDTEVKKAGGEITYLRPKTDLRLSPEKIGRVGHSGTHHIKGSPNPNGAHVHRYTTHFKDGKLYKKVEEAADLEKKDVRELYKALDENSWNTKGRR